MFLDLGRLGVVASVRTIMEARRRSLLWHQGQPCVQYREPRAAGPLWRCWSLLFLWHSICMIIAMIASSLAHAIIIMPSSLTPRYLARLGMPSNTIPNADDVVAMNTNNSGVATLELLQTIQELHLARIPFENTAQHGVDADGPACVTDVDATAHKILDRHRGGFCFELNGLLGEWLTELGYKVCRVPARVYTGECFQDEPSHMVLIVQCCGCDTTATRLYYVDVGFGEPPLQPLVYYGPDGLYGQEQITCEGMCSRFSLVKNDNGDEDDDTVVLSWFRDGAWRPRLKWSYQASLLLHGGTAGPTLAEFRDGLQRVLDNSSIFAQKLIACRLTRDQKVTLAGHRLKITQPRGLDNNSSDNDDNNAEAFIVQEVQTNGEGRKVLETHFGIPYSSSEGLDLDESRQADPKIWSLM